MKPGKDPLTLMELQRQFCDEPKCLAFLERVRWPAGPDNKPEPPAAIPLFEEPL